VAKPHSMHRENQNT